MTWSHCDLARDVVHVEGPDAGGFLHSQLAQDIATLDVGGSVHSLLLEPTGHVVALLRVVRHDIETYTVDVESGFGAVVVTRLRPFVLRSRVTLQHGDWVVRAFRGPGVRASCDGCRGLAVAWPTSDDAVDAVAPVADLPRIGESIGSAEADAIRVDARWPRMGTDILAGDVPATTGVLGAAVSFTKGCYPGQELVERMHSRGSDAPVMLRALARDGHEPGDVLMVEGREVGVVTSVGTVLALARVSRGVLLGEPLG